MSDLKARLLGVLLAGGLSRRMGGGDKCMIPIAGKPMLGHAIDRLAPQVGAMVINANGDPGRFAGFGLTVVPDTIEGFAGPLAGVLAGLQWARQHCPGVTHIVSAASDTPFFPTDLARRFAAAAMGDTPTIALAETGGTLHPVFGLWPVAVSDDLEEWLKTSRNRKVLAFVDLFPSLTVAFDGAPTPGGLDPFFNANSPEDLQRAETALAEAAS